MFYPTVSDSLFSDFDSIFNSLVRPAKTRRYSLVDSRFSPKANISQDDTGYQVSLAAPGLSYKKTCKGKNQPYFPFSPQEALII